MIDELPRLIAAAPDKPVRAGAESTRRHSLALARDPSSWSAGEAADVRHAYDELAPGWDTERGAYRPVPVRDALARGGPFPAGLCLDIGGGTGLLTPLLSAVWPRTVCLDLTLAMLRRAPGPARVQADASRLPFPDGVAAAVVLADAPLFAEEVARVLAPGGVVLWSNALGTDAPHHVPVAEVLAALGRAAPGKDWRATTAEAGWGLWAVLRPVPS